LKAERSRRTGHTCQHIANKLKRGAGKRRGAKTGLRGRGYAGVRGIKISDGKAIKWGLESYCLPTSRERSSGACPGGRGEPESGDVRAKGKPSWGKKKFAGKGGGLLLMSDYRRK